MILSDPLWSRRWLSSFVLPNFWRISILASGAALLAKLSPAPGHSAIRRQAGSQRCTTEDTSCQAPLDYENYTIACSPEQDICLVRSSCHGYWSGVSQS